MSKKEFHFFTTSIVTWNTDEDLFQCLLKQQKTDKSSGYNIPGCDVWKVFLNIDENYRIEDYRPVVKNIEYIDYILYKRPKKVQK